MPIYPYDINPIRFKSNLNTIDWDDYWPNNHLMNLRTEYFKGEYPESFYPTFIKDKTIKLQFGITGITDKTITVTKPDLSTEVIEGTNVSPSGWTGYTAFNYEYTFASTGKYSFAFNEGDVVSDTVYVFDRTKLKKQTLQIQYYNSYNEFNVVFYNGTELVFAPTAYLQGIIKGGSPLNEKSTFISDRGILVTKRSTPIPIDTVQIEIHRTYRDMINLIFGCDNLIINNVRYQAPDAPVFEPINKTDMFVATIELYEVGYDYSRKIIE